MADVAQAPLPIVPHAQPDLVRDEDDDMQAASPQESDLIPTPSDDPSSIHFAPNGTGKHLAGDMDITMNGADADHEEEDDNISVDMDTGSPTPASSHSNENVQAPPSPAPSGGDSTAKPVFQRSPSSTTALSINAHTATPDHPENSIPSPASPVAELPQMVTPTVEVEATTSITANDIELDVATPKVASVTTVTESASGLVPSASLASTSTKHEQEDADAMEEQRPAKRARTADIASSPASPLTASVSTPATTKPSSSQASSSSSNIPLTTFSPAQFKFAQSALRSIRKHKDAWPFNQPVDPIALNVPHYRNIITHPMDFQTVDFKLQASNPSKPDLTVADTMRYYSAKTFMDDVELVFHNCYLFNGPENTISQCARKVQTVFEKAAKNMPPPQAPAPLVKPSPAKPVASSSTPSSSKIVPQPALAKAPTPVAAAAAAPVPPPKKSASRRPSNAVPVIRRTDSATASEFVSARPKREIHPPPPKDSDYVEVVPKRSGSTGSGAASGSVIGKSGSSKKKKRDDGTLDQLKYCLKIVNDLYKKQYSSYAQYFYDPVNEEYAPGYYKIIKRPMDLSTLKRNLDQKHYTDANGFYEDFQLMINNCVRYNPVGTAVYIAGQDLLKAFSEKWRGVPPLHTPPPSDDEDEESGEFDTLQALEAQLAGLKDSIDQLKNKEKVKKQKSTQVPRAPAPAPVAPTPRASTSTASAPKRPAPKKAGGSSKKNAAGANGNGRRALDADASLTFDEKKELSEAIQTLEESELDEVIRIIKEGVPEIGDTTDEIELEIDALPANVLRQLWDTVIKPKQAPVPATPANASKPFKQGRNQSHTGGTKRKSMDEQVESEKMRALEARINLFDQAVTTGSTPGASGANGQTPSVATVHGANDADSTDSESDSGSSSDSD